MKEKIIRGKRIKYAESLIEIRAMLPEEHRHQLMLQPGSAVAICTNSYQCELKDIVSWLSQSHYYWERRSILRRIGFKILVSHRTDNDKYSLIGGAKELGESFEETALRELSEESGVKPNELLFLGLISGGNEMVNIYPDGNACEGIDALYLVVVHANVITRSNSETKEFLWMTPDNIKDAIAIGQWHCAQVKTVQNLLSSLLQLPEIYALKEMKVNW